MGKSSENSYANFSLSGISTYQSGVAQASAFRVVKKSTALALQSYNLTSMQWFTIGTVFDAGEPGIRMSDLAQKLNTTLAYMTNTVNLLESRGILIKKAHASDARTKLVSVDPDYRDTCLEIEVYLRKSLRKLLYDKITPEELTTYVKVLYKISNL